MARRGAGAVLLAAASCVAGCSAATRHRVLDKLFDGVPPPRPPKPVAAAAAGGADKAGAPDQPPPSKPTVHGPYAARMCSACHASEAGNSLVAPSQQLCLQCHQFPHAPDAYVHGPLASGGCVVCHEPHSSPNRYLLVSDSEAFCFHCHDRERMRGHAGGQSRCTTCHDAHMSTKKFLLR